MAVSHVLSSPIADFTGTVTVFDSAGSTQTANATEIVRPSDWNSAHNQFLTLVGNTAGQSTLSGTNIVWAGGPNVTLSANAGTVSVSVGAGGAGDGVNLIAAGTQTAASTGTVLFNNGNGVTFGMANSSVVTASVNTNYQTPGAYLTTAMASNASSVFAGVGETVTTTTGTALAMTVDTNGVQIAHPLYLTTAQPVGAYLTTARASNDAVGLNTALTAGPLAWTVNSNGLSLNAGSAAGTTSGFGGNLISGSMTHNTAGLNLSLNHPAWLTTAMASNAVTLSNIRVSGGTTSNLLSAITFANGNGVSFGLNAGTMTASHNGLTTAAASDHSHGNPTLALTNLSGTTASNSAGFTLSLSAGAGGAGDGGNILAAGTRTAGTNSTVLFDNANGITFGLNAVNGSVMTASHNALTTARASNDALGLNTAATNVTWTANSAGVSLNAAGYAGTGTTFAGANISASVTLNSVGWNGSFSVAAPGAAAENNWFALTGNTSGNTTASGSTIALSGGNNITLSGTNGSVIRIDAPASSSLVGTNGISLSTNGSTVSISNIGVNVSAGTTSNNMTAVTFSNANGVSFGLNGSVMTASAAGGAGPTLSVYEPYEFANNTAFSSHGQNTLYLQRLWPELNYTFANVEKIASLSFVSSTNSQSVAHTIRYGLYSRDTGTNSTRMTQVGSSAVIFIASFASNTQAGYTVSQSGGGSYTTTSAGTGILSQYTAGKLFYLPYAGSLQAGVEYAFGFHVSTASTVGTSPARLSFLELTNLNNTTLGKISPSTVQLGSATNYEEWDQVMHRTTQNGLIASYQDSECQVAVSRARQYLIFET